MMGMLVSLSDYSKKLNNEHTTLLAPTNASLDNYSREAIGAFRYPESKALLNTFVEKHIIPSVFSINKYTENTTVKNLHGDDLNLLIDARTIGGAHYSGVEFMTDHGIVISMDGAIDFPMTELKMILQKHANDKKVQQQKPA